MKKVSMRAYAAIFLAMAVIAGMLVYIIKYVNNGADWAMAYAIQNSSTCYTVNDRNGVLLAQMSGAEKTYAEDAGTRTACYQLIGDYTGNVSTGALQSFNRELAGYNLITGVKERDDSSISLTVDSELNKVAYSALNGRNGCVMMSNYKTGEILCMVSAPAIDPLNPPAEPQSGTYLNKCITGAFVPGSIFKLITLAAAIENIPDLQSRTFDCGGSINVKGVNVTCTGTHGSQTIEQALANSCNCVFGNLALELGPDILSQYAEKFGFTSKHMLDSITTAAGTYDKDENYSAALAWSGIGQYNDLVCPYSMLRFVSAIANGGEVIEPSLLGVSNDKTTLINQATASRLASQMSYNVVYKYGTGTFPGLDIAGKTGTAELDGQESHAWFTGFLNDPSHPYAFIILVENGGSGIVNAAPVANAILQYAVSHY